MLQWLNCPWVFFYWAWVNEPISGSHYCVRSTFSSSNICHLFELEKNKRRRKWYLKCFVLSDKKTSKYSWYSCVLFGSDSGLIHGLVSPTVYWPVQIFRSIKTRDFYCKVGVRDDVTPRRSGRTWLRDCVCMYGLPSWGPWSQHCKLARHFANAGG